MKRILLLFILFSCMVVYGEDVIIENTMPLIKTEQVKRAESVTNNDIGWGPYMKQLEQRIKRNWTPPKNNKSEKIVTRFTILKDGTITDIKIIKSSGVPLIDDSALSAIKNTSPYKPLPEKFEGESLPIEYTFDYNLLTTGHNDSPYDNCKTKLFKFLYKN